MPAQVKNPRKKFNFSLTFPKHPLNPFLCQKVNLPDLEIEQVSHGDINSDVKTAGRVSVGNITVEKLLVTSGSDTWGMDWFYSAQDPINGGGLTPAQYKEEMVINELAEDGVSIINSWLCTGVWPCKVSGIELDRTSSDNTIETIEFSVDTVDKY